MMKFNHLLTAIFMAIFMALPFASTAFAHRDGCHTHHSCPSDTGSYVCGDLGIDTYCPKAQQLIPDVSSSTPNIGSAEIIPLEDKSGTINRSSNIRSGPGTNFAIVGTGRAGQVVTISGQTVDGSWYQLNDSQWIAASLVNSEESVAEIVTEPTANPPVIVPSSGTAVTSGIINQNSNIRSGPGANFPVVGTGKSGQNVSILERNSDSSWVRIGDNQWIAAFLFTPGSKNDSVTAPQPASQAAPAAPIVPQLPTYWKDASKATCGNFEWKVVDVRRPDGLWFLSEGAVRQNESFLVVYIEITNIGPVTDRLINIQPTVGGSNLPDWDASYNAAWMMTGGQNNPWEYFNPGQVITIAAAYDVPRNDAYGFGMMTCAGNFVNIGEWNALDKNAIRANTN